MKIERPGCPTSGGATGGMSPSSCLRVPTMSISADAQHSKKNAARIRRGRLLSSQRRAINGNVSVHWGTRPGSWRADRTSRRGIGRAARSSPGREAIPNCCSPFQEWSRNVFSLSGPIARASSRGFLHANITYENDYSGSR